MNEVPFLDLGAAYRELRPDLDAALSSVAASGWYISGPAVEEFEGNFASYADAKECVGVGNGLDALHLALRAVDVCPGDEVIVPAATFIATWLSVVHAGAIPVPVDVLPLTATIDPELVEAAITPKTRAIVPVHLYGHPADLQPLLDIAERRDLRVVEDAAQAHGALYNERRVGAHGDAVAWSFYPGKNLGAFGDGGAVTTNRSDVAERIRELRNYGSSKKYRHDVIGFNSRLDPVQAAVLTVKLRHLDEWNDRRRIIAARYLTELAGTDLQLPQVSANANPAWHLFVVRHARRDDLQKLLTESGVHTLIHYPVPIHRQRAFAQLQIPDGRFPRTDALHRDVLSLPIGPHLSEDQVSRVISATTRASSRLSSSL